MKTALKRICNALSQPETEDGKMGLLTGECGRALFLLYYSKHLRTDEEKLLGEKILDNVFNSFQDEKLPPATFCAGLSGIGFAVEKLSEENLISVDTEEILCDADLYLRFQLKNLLTLESYDFLYGYTGLGLYFHSRKKDCSNSLQSIMDQLHASAERSNGSLKWKSRSKSGNNTFGYNIGLSHGMSSIAVFLSKILKSYPSIVRVPDLLQGVIGYILAQELDVEKQGSYFPTLSVESSNVIQKSRLAWCYGDLGIALALWQSGCALQNEAWKNKALEVLLYAAEKRRDLGKENVVDAGLCHGTAGIAHIFYRMWWNTRLPELKQAADFWFAETVKMACFNDGLAGYKTWHGKIDGWENEYGILEGVAGIGLALLSYITETEPTWDECLLLS